MTLVLGIFYFLQYYFHKIVLVLYFTLSIYGVFWIELKILMEKLRHDHLTVVEND